MKKLTNNNIELTTNDQGEIASIKFHEEEILHEGKEHWAKTYPMIWPMTSFSRAFVVDGKNYEIPKHGFWKELDWEEIFENGSLVQLATHHADEKYPFTIDVENRISIINDSVTIATTFSNLSKKTAYFNFGHHPAFKIDKDSEFAFSKLLRPQFAGFKQQAAPFEKIDDMPFGEAYDTIVFHDALGLATELIYKNIKIKLIAKDFNTTQLWKPKDANFVCIEPWQGYNDDEYEYPQEASQKHETIILEPGSQTTKSIIIELKKL